MCDFCGRPKQSSHRGDCHDSTVRLSVIRVPVEVTYEQNIFLSSVRLLEHTYKRPPTPLTSALLWANPITPDDMDGNH